MKKRFLVLLSFLIILSIFPGCNLNDSMQTELQETPTTAAHSQTPVSSAATVVKKLYLNNPAPINEELIIYNDDGTYTVDITEDVWIEDYLKNTITMPSYIWHVNPEVNDNIENVVVEFELIDVCNDAELAGFEKGYFLGLTNTETIELKLNEGCPDKYLYDLDYCLPRPFLMNSLDKYISQEENFIKAVVPYNKFMTASRDIVLQFIPGSTFANINVYVEGNDVSETDIEQLTDKTQIEHVNVVSPHINEAVDFYLIYDDEQWFGQSSQPLSPFTYEEVYFDLFADDNSIKMYLSDMGLSEYEDEIDCEFGTVPDLLFYPLMVKFFDQNLGKTYLTDLVRFVYENMRAQETGLISGIWDCENHLLLAKDRTCANFPLMLLFTDFLSLEEISEMFKASLKSEVININGKYYYAPHGLQDNMTIIKLEDLCNVGGCDFNEELKETFGIVMLVDRLIENGLIDYKEAEVYTQAIANSFGLVMEAQQNNPTNLPAEAITVTFSDDGSYTIENEGDLFNIDNYFYQSIQNSYTDRYIAYSEISEYFHIIEDRISPDLDQIEQNMYFLNLYRNCYAINLYQYKIFKGVYDFIKVQDAETRYAPRYNLDTGEPHFNDGNIACPHLDTYNRFGSPKEFTNWMAVAGCFTDYELIYELEALMTDYFLETRSIDYYSISNYSFSYKLNIDINKDYFCGNYFRSYFSNNVIFPVTPPPDAESISWRLSTGEHLKAMYWKYEAELSQEAEELIGSLSCEPLY